MKSARSLLLILVTLILVPPPAAQAKQNPKSDDARDVRSAIEKSNQEFSRAFEQGDAKALAGMYTPDGIVFPPDSEMVRGNEAIGQFWRNTRNGGVKSAVLKTLDVGRSGDLAYEVGTVTLTIQPEGKEPTTEAAKYVVVWMRQADGSWKLHRDIWNSLPAPR